MYFTDMEDTQFDLRAENEPVEQEIEDVFHVQVPC